ncbi:MAG: (Fe-S)-binding protein [Thioploca sp.]|nr:(Fe-S)-binding protein [Thioploca sp.]
MSSKTTNVPQIGLFITCLVDLFRPNVGFSALKLLEHCGCHVEVPIRQTCCGQIAYNNGDINNSRLLAQQLISEFESYDYIVAPSGSCIGMLKRHYLELFTQEPYWQAKAQNFADRCYELVSFLTEVQGMTQVNTCFEQKVTYHDSCSGLRELGIQMQPRQLLNSISGLTLIEMKTTQECCGFGGTFCVKYSPISARLLADKVAHIQATGAQVVLAGDMGCLLNIAGYLKRLASSIKVYHVAEVLAGKADIPAMGKEKVP